MSVAHPHDTARHLAKARRARSAMPALPPALRPGDADAAYAVQRELHRELLAGGPGDIAGYKIGCTSAVMQRYLGIDSPCAGGVPAAFLQHRQGRYGHEDFVRVGVECELAVVLGGDLEPGAGPPAREQVTAAVAGVAAAIEVVDDRWRDYRVIDTPSLIADDFFAAGGVLGTLHEGWRDLDLGSLAGRMRINDELVGDGRGDDILGDPLGALEWIASLFARQGRCLVAGQVVLLGSIVKTCWLDAGDAVTVEIDGLGRVDATFE